MTGYSIINLTTEESRTLESFHESLPLSIFPDGVKPYMELVRLHRPAGIMMFYFPCLYGTLLVGALRHEISLSQMIIANLQLLLLSFFLRGSLVSYNDICDIDIDRQVRRTRIRPLARGALGVQRAVIWTLFQTVLVVAVFVLLPSATLYTALPFLGFHLFYPFGKRITHHPQLILGFAHSLGVFIAFPVLGQTLSIDWYDVDFMSASCLSAAIIFWTLLNDTIYAAQDVEDDKKAGVGSTMVFWEDSIRLFIRVLGLLQMVSLLAVSVCMRQNAPTGGTVFNVLTCGGTLLGVTAMVEMVDLNDPASCGWWFNRGNIIIGWAIASGLVGEYLAGQIQRLQI